MKSVRLGEKAMCNQVMPEREWRQLAASAKYKVIPLAALAGIGERRLRRVFHRLFGCSPRVWLRRVRLEEATQLLREGHQVKWVSYSLFYPDTMTFAHQFMAQYGMSPRDYATLARTAGKSPVTVPGLKTRIAGLTPSPTVSSAVGPAMSA